MKPVMMMAMLAALFCTGTAQAATNPPNVIGTWKPTGDSAAARVGEALAGWAATPQADLTVRFAPSVIVDQQQGRSVAGRLLLADGKTEPLVGVFKRDGKHIIMSSASGAATGDLFGGEIEWCWTDTVPSIIVAVCHMLRKEPMKH
jgi:hypothetical protein